MFNYQKHNCQTSTATEAAYQKDYNFYKQYEYGYNPCLDCLNNPANGGSGVCNCTLPDYYQKRWTGDRFNDYLGTKPLEPTKFYNVGTSTDLVFKDKKEKSVTVILNNRIKKVIKVPCHVVKEDKNNE